MTDDCKSLLKKARLGLIDYLVVSTRLLADLLSKDVLTESEHNDVVERQRPSDKIQYLLMVLETKSNDQLNEFVNSLTEVDQDHVANIIIPGKGSEAMSKLHRDMLRTALPKVTCLLDFDGGLIDNLWSVVVLSDEEKEIIAEQTDSISKARHLIPILIRKNDHAFNIFYHALISDNQQHVAYVIDPGCGEDCVPLTPKNVQLLNRNAHYLLENLTLNAGSLSALLDNSVITPAHYEVLSGIECGRRRIKRFREILLRRPDSAFQNYLEVLHIVKQGHVAKDLGQFYEVIARTNNTAAVPVVDSNRNLLNVSEGVEVEAVREGSIRLLFHCATVEAMQSLWEACHDNSLLNTLQDICSKETDTIVERLDIDEEDFRRKIANFNRAVMTDAHKAILQFIADGKFDHRLVVDKELLKHLGDRQVLDLDDLEDLITIQTASDANTHRKALCEMLSRKADVAFYVLMNFLQDSSSSADLYEEITGRLTNYTPPNKNLCYFDDWRPDTVISGCESGKSQREHRGTSVELRDVAVQTEKTDTDFVDILHQGEGPYVDLSDIKAIVQSGPIPSSYAESVDSAYESKLTGSDTSSVQHYAPSTPSKRLKYNMKNKNKGYLFIVNNVNFSELSDRTGSEIDSNRLNKVFTKLGFIVKQMKNLTAAQMMEIAKSVGDMDHSQYDCVAVAILSHGDTDVIFAIDKPISLAEFSKPIKNCKTLVGKPKLFILQVSRGAMLDEGQEPLDAPEDSADRIPTEADCLYAFATPQGYFAWRNTNFGSYFVQRLCDVLDEEDLSRVDMAHILTEVSSLVAQGFQSTVRVSRMHHKKQIPSYESTLTRDLYLRTDPEEETTDAETKKSEQTTDVSTPVACCE